MNISKPCLSCFLAIAGGLFISGTASLAGDDELLINGQPLAKLIETIQSSDRGAQVRAARALAEAPVELHVKLVPFLLPLLKSERENARPWAAQALGCYGSVARAAVSDLMPLLQGNQYERNRAAAAKALGQILKGAESCEEVDKVTVELVRLFDDKYMDVRREAVKACGMIGLAAKACIPSLAKRIGDAAAGDSTTRAAGKEAVWTCGEFGPLAACHIDRMISIMHAGPVPETIEAIGKIGPVNENVVKNIVDRMEQVAAGNVMVQEGSRNGPINGTLIRENMKAAFDALARIGPRSAAAVPYLQRLISAKGWERNKDYALGALKVLGAIGPAAKDTVPVIETNCLTSHDPVIKKAAEEVLVKIKGV